MEEKQVHAGHRERLKQRFIENNGFDGFADHNILEMLLFYSISRKDTNELAHSLIERFGSFERVLEASFEELTSVKGISDHSACLIKMILPTYRRYSENLVKDKRTFANMEEVTEYLHSVYAGIPNERVILLCFDAKMNLLAKVVLSEGDINSSGFSVRKVMEAVISHKAEAVVLAHNHPHSLSAPSASDRETTKRIDEMLKAVNVELLDHIIIAGAQHSSCMESFPYYCAN